MTYNEFAQKINDMEIKQISFSVSGYGHYKNCTVGWENMSFSVSGKSVSHIGVRINLTRDGSETVFINNGFDGRHRIFSFGHNQKYTLEQIWDRVEICDVIYFTEQDKATFAAMLTQAKALLHKKG